MCVGGEAGGGAAHSTITRIGGRCWLRVSSSRLPMMVRTMKRKIMADSHRKGGLGRGKGAKPEGLPA